MVVVAGPEVWIITGIPGAGKSTTARALAEQFDRSVLISGDELQEFIVQGKVYPDHEPLMESRRQMALNVHHQCLLARSFAEAGFTAVIEYVVVTRERLAIYQQALTDLPLYLVVLDPGQEIARERDRQRPEKIIGDRYVYLQDLLHAELEKLGYWINNGRITPTQTVARILQHRLHARLPAT